MKTFFLFINLFFTGYVAVAQAIPDSTIELRVAGACGMCKSRIEKAAKGKGVSSAVWNAETQLLKLSFNPALTQREQVIDRIVAVGHDTEGRKADDKVYNALPECCLYRSGNSMEAAEANALPQLRGVVLEENEKGGFAPLPGATVQWLQSGAAVMTNENGVFSIPYDGSSTRLIISYTGYRPDTLSIKKMDDMVIVLAKGKALGEVVVTARQRSMYISSLNPIRTQIMTEKELFKAACCNLSESFETNPSVDVSYSDAVTGSKQIQLLGLSGNYTQLTVENLPGPRGLATPMGLNTIAGPWIESIQLTKGIGSVANGFESIAGQINVELKKPEKAESLFLNVYQNDMGKTDLNLNLSRKLSKRWSSTLLLHGDFLYNREIDFNKDSFRDLPTGRQWSGINRWKYEDDKGWIVQFGVKALTDQKTGGEVAFDPAQHRNTTQHYGLGMDTRRVEAFAKTGYVFPAKKYQSIGLQLSAFDHRQDAYFGFTTYNAEQKNFYANLLYQSIIGNSFHKFRTGLSLLHDRYNERFNALQFARTEVVPGAFFEYTYEPGNKFTLVAGLRADRNNLYGWFATPRLHLRYEPVKGTTFRISAGRGQRTANILAENTGVFVSARSMEILAANSEKAYGLQPEIAWNKGISFDQQFRLFDRTASLALDFFRNDFSSQVVVDLEDVRKIRFYQLDGKSYSNSFQMELNMQPLKNFEVRLAYRYFDVKTTFSGNLLERPFTARHRAFANLAYEIGKWKLDYTISYIGSKRIPSTVGNPVVHQRNDGSPGYVFMNAQVSRVVGKKYPVDFYLGSENLGNFFQRDLIIAPDMPFGLHFDASLVWGPVIGRMIYAGFRFKLK